MLYNCVFHCETQSVGDVESRNSALLRAVLDHESHVPDSYDRFVEALRKSNQQKLAAQLVITSIGVRRNSIKTDPGLFTSLDDF